MFCIVAPLYIHVYNYVCVSPPYPGHKACYNDEQRQHGRHHQSNLVVDGIGDDKARDEGGDRLQEQNHLVPYT